MSDVPSERVSPVVIRDLFNDADYVGQVRSAILYESIRRCKQKRPCLGNPDDPPQTLSQIVEYYDRHGERIAVVHRYVRPDGTLGGSGKQDPKRLLHNGVLYLAERTQPPPCHCDCEEHGR